MQLQMWLRGWKSWDIWIIRYGDRGPGADRCGDGADSEGETGTIHYSYYLPDDYDMETEYPLMVVMPGYDMMWFGEDSSGSNLKWTGFLCWTELPEDMIVVSAQLTDWHDTSAIRPLN